MGRVPLPLIDISYLNGMFVGSLTEGELQDFNRAVDHGIARRKYEGGAGFMGLAKVEILQRVSPHAG